jgi:hypothetical protein
VARIKRRTTRAELGAIVCEVLSKLDDSPVLVGGAAVSIYSEGRFVSDDLDVVTYRSERQIAPLMSELGFSKKGSHWVHPSTKLYVQFVNPPPMIGTKYIKKPDRMKTAEGPLSILSPLDCACDRLAWFLGGDSQSLEQCVDVIVAQKIPLQSIRAWLRGEPWPEKDKKEALELIARGIERRRAK